MENKQPSDTTGSSLIDYYCTRALARDIVSRSTKLHAELARLQHMFSLQAKGHLPGLNPLIHGVEVEKRAAHRALDSLERVLPTMDGDVVTDDVERIRSRLTFSNLDAMERDWDIIKRCSSLVSIGQEFARCSHGQLQPKAGPSQLRRETAFADAAVDGGSEWLRIINTTEKRLLHQMAEEGWDWDQGDGSDSEDPESCYGEDLVANHGLEGGIPLVRIIHGLVEASRATRCKYRHPRLKVVLTRLNEGANIEVDKLITRLRGLGRGNIEVSIHCANSAFMRTPPPALEQALVALIQDDMSVLSSTVLIDTSVLVALASDVANSSLKVQPWHRSDLRAQIGEEARGRNFMVLNACPVLRGRQLVCTRDAARHFWQIVSLIGSKTEVERAGVLLAPLKANPDGGDLLERLRGLSVHVLPSDLRLPIRIIETAESMNAEALVANGKLPRSALEVDRDLLALPANRSTFLHGWLTDFTIITSNATLATRLERLVEQHRETDTETGPRLFIFPFNRALTTKGSRRMMEERTNKASEEGNS